MARLRLAPLETVRKVLKVAKEPLSLETPIGDEEDSHLGDLIEDKNTIQPIDAAIQSNLRCDYNARAAHALWHGMNSDHTLEEVGQQFSVTRERIRQIEAKGLRKLKHPSRSRILRTFLDNWNGGARTSQDPTFSNWLTTDLLFVGLGTGAALGLTAGRNRSAGPSALQQGNAQLNRPLRLGCQFRRLMWRNQSKRPA
jgi:hypothetical protein